MLAFLLDAHTSPCRILHSLIYYRDSCFCQRPLSVDLVHDCDLTLLHLPNEQTMQSVSASCADAKPLLPPSDRNLLALHISQFFISSCCAALDHLPFAHVLHDAALMCLLASAELSSMNFRGGQLSHLFDPSNAYLSEEHISL